MSKAEMNITENQKSDDNKVGQSDDKNIIPMRRVKPLLVASAATLLWLLISVYILEKQIELPEVLDLSFLSSLAGGILLPIVLFWLVALVFQRSDPLLERRLSMIQNLNTTLAPIDLAEKRLETLNKNISNQFESIEAIADIASNSLDKLEKRFEEQTSQLFSASADMEAKAAIIRERLSKESELFAGISTEIDTKHDAIKNMMDFIKTSLEDTNQTIKDTIDAAIEKTRNQANVATAAAIKLTEDIAKYHDTLEDQSQKVLDTSDVVEGRLSDINSALITNADRLRDDITELDKFAGDIVEDMRNEVILVEEMSQRALNMTEKIEVSLKQQVDHVQNAADGAMERTLEAGNIINEHAINIASMFSQTMEKATDAATKTMQDIARQTAEAKDQSLLSYGEITSANKTMISGILDSATEVTNSLDDTIAKAQQTMSDIGQKLSQHEDKAEMVTKTAANDAINTLETLHQRLSNSLNLFTQTVEGGNQNLSNQATSLTDHTALLASTAENATQALKAANDTINATGEGFGQSLDNNRQALTILEQDLTKQQDSLSSLSKTLNDTLRNAQNTIESTGEKLRNEADDANSKIAYMSDNLSVTTQNIIEFGKSSEESITQLADKIRTESQHVRVDLDLSKRAFEDIVTDIENERKHMTDHVEGIGTQLRGASDKLKDRITDITKAATDAAGTSDNMISDLSGLKMQYERAMQSALNQFHDALSVAEENSNRLSSTLSSEADRVRDEASSFISKTQEIEERIAGATKDDFLRSSNAILDSLQSTSIDIDKMLDNEIPDDIWDKFISGDRSIFARRTIKLATRESKKAIADKFISDKKFREHVARFMKDFESLMQRSMLNDKGSAMSITLISSTMGKLYVLLAQSLKKIQ